MTEKHLKIHSDNLLPIIKKWLYTDRDIFLRELISNACDALSKLFILREKGEATFKDDTLRIDVTADPKAKTLTISDTGLGMTGDEVEQYIAQIAVSGAEEFVKKYEKDASSIIGHFGLGFYSAFMVARRVTIDTLSYKAGAKAAFWSCDGGATYLLEEGKRVERGTTITLFLSEEEYAGEGRLHEILSKHCMFLPYPIYLNGKRINEKEPLWLKGAAQCSDKEYIDFYHTLYPFDKDPIFWVHLNIDYPFHLQGILYFPKLGRHLNPNETRLSLYCNRVFVSDNCKDLLPDFLTILHGVIDSPDIPLNVSRSNLQMDRTVRQLSAHIAKKVADKLENIKASEPETFQTLWPDLELIIKLGCLQDERFFDRAKDLLLFKTSDNQWLSLSALSGTVLYTTSDALPQLYQKPVLQLTSPLDIHLLSLLEAKCDLTFQRTDGHLSPDLIDTQREKSLLDADGKSLQTKIQEKIASLLSEEEQLTIEAKSLATDTLPAIVIFDEKARRLRDSLAYTGDLNSDFLKRRTLVVNTNHPLIESIYSQENSERAKKLALALYELTLLSQKELPPNRINALVERLTALLT